MKTKKIEKKLILNKTTITTVTGDQLNNVNGGATRSCQTCAASVCVPTCDEYGGTCRETEYANCTIFNCYPTKPSNCYPYC